MPPVKEQQQQNKLPVYHQFQQLWVRHPKWMVLVGMTFLLGVSIGRFMSRNPGSSEDTSSIRSFSKPSSASSRTSVSVSTYDSTVSYELAKKESFDFFDDISDEHWNRYKKRAQSESMYFDPIVPHSNSSNQPLWLLENMDPIFTCPHLVRVGGRGDGPKWTCDPHRLIDKEDCLIYSIGSMGIYLFEDALVSSLQDNYLYKSQQKTLPKNWRSNCEIHVFDPDPSYARKKDGQRNNIHYHPWGLKSSYEPFSHGAFPKHFQFYSLPEILEKLGHTHRRIDIFKIDCESCEWSTYRDWIQPEKVDIRQILVETHKLPPKEKPNIYFDTFTNNGFVLFSKEANTHPIAEPKGVYFEWGYIRLHSDFFNQTAIASTGVA